MFITLAHVYHTALDKKSTLLDTHTHTYTPIKLVSPFFYDVLEPTNINFAFYEYN